MRAILRKLSFVAKPQILILVFIAVFGGVGLLVSRPANKQFSNPSTSPESAVINATTSTPDITEQENTSQGASGEVSSSNTSNRGNTGTNAQPSPGAIGDKKGKIIFSPNKVIFPEIQLGASFEASLDPSTPIVVPPKVSQVPGLSVYVETAPPAPGQTPNYSKWRVRMTRTEHTFNNSGEAYITVTIGNLSEKILVVWKPIPALNVIQGKMIRTAEDATTITYTANLTLEPNAHFGSPTITMWIQGAGTCINTGSLSKSFVYSGQNILSISCVVEREKPHVPGSPPGPITGKLGFNVYVDVLTASGNYLPTKTFFYLSDQSPYNR